MTRKHFKYHTGDSVWKDGSTLIFWESYVKQFFEQFPKGEIRWFRDS